MPSGSPPATGPSVRRLTGSPLAHGVSDNTAALARKPCADAENVIYTLK